jgi:nuclear pore complex protein Nup133
LPSIWSSQAPQAEAGNIAAIALGAKTNLGTDIWALVESRIQKWNVAAEGWEELTLQEDVGVVLRHAIQDTLRAPSTYLDLELLDLAVDRLVPLSSSSESLANGSLISTGKLLVLTSHGDTGEHEDMAYSSTPRRIYNVAQISMSSSLLQVEKLIGVPYQSVRYISLLYYRSITYLDTEKTFRASEAPMHPQLRLMLEGAILIVQFGDAIAFCSRGSQSRFRLRHWSHFFLDNDYKDRIELKSSTDRTLGVCVADAQSFLLVLTASTIMKVALDFDQVQTFDSE